MNTYQSHFPFFKNNPGITYLDSASTAQKPDVVMRAVNEYLESGVANPERGTYNLAQKVETDVERVRKDVAQFIGAPNDENVVFTSGTTASLNFVAQGLRHRLSPKDEVLVYPSDHQACVAPWTQTDAKTRHYKIDPHTGRIDTESILSQVSGATKVVVATHSHNIFGVVNDITELKNALPDHCLLIVDAAQTVGHVPVNVEALGADAFVFSGHKIFALEGVGVLWMSARIREMLQPVHFGGGDNTFEPGTRNTAGILSLGAAIKFINDIGIENIERRIQELIRYSVTVLGTIPGIEFLPGSAFDDTLLNTGIVSFNLANISAADVADQLNERGICVRAGLHCSFEENPLYDSVRISIHIYNTEEDIDRIADALRTLG